MIDYVKDAPRVRATAAQCRELAKRATDPAAAKSLRFIACELEAILSILAKDEARWDGTGARTLFPVGGRSHAPPAPPAPRR